MTTKTLADASTNTDLAAIALVVMMGLGLIFVAGFASSQTIHDTGHDQRHALAFPCH